MHHRRPFTGRDDGRERHTLSTSFSRCIFHGRSHFHFFDTRPNLSARDLERFAGGDQFSFSPTSDRPPNKWGCA
jgi:hypothetical protein